ncbi:MAG: hypothetical protein ABWX76_13275, partial [Leifsonia flava]
VGAANNQLADHDGAEQLAERGILWAPDFVANAGGVIYLDMASQPGADLDSILRRVDGIGETTRAVYRTAREQGITTLAAAEKLATDRLEAASVRKTDVTESAPVEAPPVEASTPTATGQFLQPA